MDRLGWSEAASLTAANKTQALNGSMTVHETPCLSTVGTGTHVKNMDTEGEYRVSTSNAEVCAFCSSHVVWGKLHVLAHAVPRSGHAQGKQLSQTSARRFAATLPSVMTAFQMAEG